MHFEVDVERVVFLSPPQPESPQPESLEETNTVERKQKSSLWCRRLRELPGVRERAIGLRGTLLASSRRARRRRKCTSNSHCSQELCQREP